MKKIRIIKETKDLRPNRSKKFEVGREMTVTPELAKEYLEAGLAELVGGAPVVKKVKNEKKDKE